MRTHTCARLRARRRGAAASLTAIAAAGGLAAAASAATAPTLSATADVLVGHRVVVRGSDGSDQPGQRLALELRTGNGWSTVATTTTGAGGSFAASWRPPRTGRYSLRVATVGPAAVVSAASPAHRVTVYRAVEASWYGPGLYGSALACGGTLEPGELGVANKTLPCGTRVTLRYGGRRVTVPVIDRGPYVAGREYDLTDATRARLGFPDTGTLWSSR